MLTKTLPSIYRNEIQKLMMVPFMQIQIIVPVTRPSPALPETHYSSSFLSRCCCWCCSCCCWCWCCSNCCCTNFSNCSCSLWLVSLFFFGLGVGSRQHVDQHLKFIMENSVLDNARASRMILITSSVLISLGVAKGCISIGLTCMGSGCL